MHETSKEWVPIFAFEIYLFCFFFGDYHIFYNENTEKTTKEIFHLKPFFILKK